MCSTGREAGRHEQVSSLSQDNTETHRANNTLWREDEEHLQTPHGTSPGWDQTGIGLSSCKATVHALQPLCFYVIVKYEEPNLLMKVTHC